MALRMYNCLARELSVGVVFLVYQGFDLRWPGHQDSNLDQRIQSPLCCRCTMPQNSRHDSNTFLANIQTGLEGVENTFSSLGHSVPPVFGKRQSNLKSSCLGLDQPLCEFLRLLPRSCGTRRNDNK